MTFWLVAAAMTAVVAAALAWPLLGKSRQADERRAYDRQVYRDQLAEVERDLARGVLTPGQADAARLEIKRRLLASQDRDERNNRKPDSPSSAKPTGKPASSGRALLAGVVSLIVAASAFGLYLELGSPGVPGRPYAQRPQQPERQQATEAALARVAELRERLEEDPADLRAWVNLGDAYRALQRYQDAAESYRQALARGLALPDVIADYAEMLVASNDGQVVPAAREAFAVVRRVDPGNLRARFYEAAALEQEGRRQEALDLWLAVAADTPADVPWRPILENQIRRLAGELEVTLETIPTAPPAQGAAPGTVDPGMVADMSPQERQAFIESMVSRLASRLEDNPDDADGWLRLGRAYRVLGRPEDARQAFEKALAATAGRPEGDSTRQAAQRALSDLEAGR
ncbi:MAG: c-type cytochrome biogenesis protein CcmI [Rhodovibrionaceae bacterium]|nr:c-type cytochrome biogenesis protein CcmI [Rhodovibrionaceae bacterium]